MRRPVSLLILDLELDDAKHLALAVRLYRHRLERAGHEPPPDRG